MRSGPLPATGVCRVCGGPRKYATKSERCETCATEHRERCGCGGLRHDRAKRCLRCEAKRRTEPLWQLEGYA